MHDVLLELDDLTALVADVVDLSRGAQPDTLSQQLRWRAAAAGVTMRSGRSRR